MLKRGLKPEISWSACLSNHKNRWRQQVFHAEPRRDHQRHEDRRPDEARVLDEGRRAGGDLAQDPATVLEQYHRRAGGGAEDTDGHHQRDQDLHGGDAEVAQPGVEPQGGPLQPLGEKPGDVGHGAGEVAAADAG